eukprot:1263088-Amphidinium_carterae.1
MNAHGTGDFLEGVTFITSRMLEASEHQTKECTRPGGRLSSSTYQLSAHGARVEDEPETPTIPGLELADPKVKKEELEDLKRQHQREQYYVV